MSDVVREVRGEGATPRGCRGACDRRDARRALAGVPILSAVSLSAMPGEVVVIEGRSGSGKSTLCQLVAGLEAPDHGRVLVGGVAAVTVRDWSRLALLPQRLGLPAELTVAENVGLPRWVRGLPERPELLELARAGSAVLVATHDPRLVSEADQVVHLVAGRHYRGSPAAAL